MLFSEDLVHSVLDEKLINKDSNILLGLSGGPDSVFLFYFFLDLKKTIDFSFSCAHVNYNLRGEDSIGDMNFCKELCDKNNISLYIKEVNYIDLAGLQDNARNDRFSFFRTLKNKYSFSDIALAHNLDDNIETILFHIIRGCGVKGLQGMSQKDGDILRPIINLEKKYISEFLDRNNIIYRTDKSNSKDNYSRNNIRHNLVPLMCEINPLFKEKLLSLSGNSRTYYDLGKEYFTSLSEKYVRYEEGLYIIDNRCFKEKSAHIFLENFLKEELEIEKGVYKKNIDEIMNLSKRVAGKILDFSGFLFFTGYNNLYILRNSMFDRIFPDFEEEKVEKLVNNSKNLIISKNLSDVLKEDELFINTSQIKLPIILRHRKNGDRITPNRLLKKLFIDKKINKLFRDRIPVLEDDSGKILWIPGVYRIKHENVDIRIKYSSGRLFWIKN